jgi:hypothetical protein
MNHQYVKAIIEGISPVIKQLVTEEVARQVAAIEIPKGEKGDPGERGEQGEKGDPGADGKSISVDDITSVVTEAVAKSVAEIEIPQPVDGRDALALEILPMIHEERGYPRNTYAKHRGGLWRAVENTDGMHGWDCVVNGIHNAEIVQDGRKGVIRVEFSNGHSEQKQVKFAGQFYQGVFKEGEAYEAGDVVTWGGSMWHCEKDSPDGKPGNSDDWKLCVKKGRDAK